MYMKIANADQVLQKSEKPKAKSRYIYIKITQRMPSKIAEVAFKQINKGISNTRRELLSKKKLFLSALTRLVSQ